VDASLARSARQRYLGAGVRGRKSLDSFRQLLATGSDSAAGKHGFESFEENPMNSKITAGHLKRTAYLYIRQSTLRQVLENTESTQRQYALR
jgi:hypothetical protein